MALWTRGELTPTDPGDGTLPPESRDWRQGVLVRGGVLPIILPPPVIMHDPSDPRTWVTPVRWT